MAPFHKPGNSSAFNSLPSLDLCETKAVLGSIKSFKSNVFPLKSVIEQTKSTGLKWVAAFMIFSCVESFISICEDSTI